MYRRSLRLGVQRLTILALLSEVTFSLPTSKRAKVEAADPKQSKPTGGLLAAEAPKFSKGLPPVKKSAPFGSPVELVCEITGAPEAEVTWKFEGVPIFSPGDTNGQSPTVLEQFLNSDLVTHEMGSIRSVLSIPCFSPEYVGVYSCEGRNKAGHIARNTTVSPVQPHLAAGETLPPSCASHEGNKRVFSSHTWTSDRVERVNAYIQLQCRSAGVSADISPTHRQPVWRQFSDDADDYLPIEENSRDFTVLDTGDLLIKPSAECSLGCGFACDIGNYRMESFVYATILDDNGE